MAEKAIEEAAEDRRESIGVVVIGAVIVFLAGFWISVALPAADPANVRPTRLGEERQIAAPNLDTPEAAGRKIYANEGCFYCHTQQVRPLLADAYLGPASQPGDYAFDDPEFLGLRRIGPDLTHVGSSDLAKDSDALKAHLKDPRQTRPWSVMPSYDHLSEDQLDNLVAYLETLK